MKEVNKNRIFTVIDYKTFLKNRVMLQYNEKYLAGDVEPQGEDNILDIKDILNEESAQKVIDAYMVVKEFENMLDGVDECDEEE
jgi:hypothetical protein